MTNITQAENQIHYVENFQDLVCTRREIAVLAILCK
jgi:hypothetical protein